MVARLPFKEKVDGSNPSSDTLNWGAEQDSLRPPPKTEDTVAQHSDDEVRISEIAPRIDDTTQRNFNTFYEQQERNTRRESLKAAMLVIVPVVALGIGAVLGLIVLFG